MLADQEAAGAKVWASADPFMCVRLIFWIQWERNWGCLAPLPLRLEIFSPGWEVTVPSNVP